MDKMRVEGTAGNVDALEFSSVSEVKEWVKLCKALWETSEMRLGI